MKMKNFGLVLDVWLKCVPHHFIFRANSEEIFFKVKVHEYTAHPPHVNTVAERQAEEHFGSPDKENEMSQLEVRVQYEKSVYKTP